MGTNRDIESMGAREELKKSMQELGWSISRLAEVVYVHLNDDDDQAGIAKLAEKIKKELQRRTTKPERFEQYLKILQSHPEFSKTTGRVLPVYVSNDVLLPALERVMVKISTRLSTDLLDEERLGDCEE